MSLLRKFRNNTNLILKTARCVIYQVLFLFCLLLFPPPAENPCSLALGSMLVLLGSLMKVKIGSVFPPSLMPLSTMLPSLAVVS